MESSCLLFFISMESSCLLFFMLFFAAPESEACLAWGGCGYGCGISCGMGMSFCRRVHAAKTVKNRVERDQPDPDQDFRDCCENRGLPKECLNKCNYRDFTKKALIAMFLRTDMCPIEAAVELQRCAARGKEHKECCKRNAVHLTAAGDKCLLFCEQNTKNVTILDISYLPCLDRFDYVNSCFWQDAFREASMSKATTDEDEHETERRPHQIKKNRVPHGNYGTRTPSFEEEDHRW